MRNLLPLAFICLVCGPTYSQSVEEQAIKRQLLQFEYAHNNGDIDSMMQVVSQQYEETFLPDIVYDARSLRNYYNNLINNNGYRSIIKYNIEDIEANGKLASSDVTWDYFIHPSKGTDTLYYARNKGTIQWEKEGEVWKMRKTFAGNLSEVNNFTNDSREQGIQSQIYDWTSYFNNGDIERALAVYDKEVKGMSTFNGSYIFYNDLKNEYENIFKSKNLEVKYDLNGLEELKISEDLAYTIIVWNYIVHDKERQIHHTTQFRDLSIWELKDSGHWKIVSFVRKEIEH